MARTLQKKVKFSKGQVVPELIERTDLELYDSSAQKMNNLVSSVYGGVRTRRGTNKIDRIISGQTEVVGTLTTSIGGISANIQSKSATYTSEAIGTNRTLFHIDYSEPRTECLLKFRGIKLNTSANALRYIYIKASTDDTEWTTIQTKEISTTAQDFDIRLTDSFRYVKVDLENTAIKWGSSSSDAHGIMSGFNSGYSRLPSVANPRGGYWEFLFKVKLTSYAEGAIIGQTNNSLYQSFMGVSEDGRLRLRLRWGSEGWLVYATGSNVLELNTWYYVKFSFDGSRYKAEHSLDGVDYTQDFLVNNSQTYLDSGFDRIGYAYDQLALPFRGEIDINESSITLNSSEWWNGATTVYNMTDTYTLQYCLLNAGTREKAPTKIVDFVFNNTDKYVLLLQNEIINIYKNDALIHNVTATGLLNTYFNELRWAYNDDTIIFTHKDMRTKILKRLSDTNWTWGDLDWQNVPYAAFSGETITAKTTGITPSALEGSVKITASSSIFTSDWVGQYIDGNGGRVKITEYTSGTVVKGYTIIPFYTTDQITSWNYISGYEQVWSQTRGYPRNCLFAQQRLWFGGSKEKPSTVWASRVGDYFNFKNSGNYDNDSIDIDLLTNDVIVNMVYQRGIHIFTTGEEISISETTLTPDKISCTPNTKNGSSVSVRPVIIDGAVCFIEKNGKSLLSYVYDDNQASYLTDNLSVFSNLIQSPVSMAAEINSSKDKGNFLYMVLNDGTMIVGCIVVSQKIVSLSEFKTENGNIKDVISIYGDTYILVDRGNYYYLEKITDSLTDCTTQVPVYDSTITVLSDYEGKEAYIYDDNRNIYGKGVVSQGSLYVDKIPNKTCHVGMSFKYELESNPVAIKNQTVGIKKRITTAKILCEDTYRLSFCGQEKYGKDEYKFYACTPYGNSVKYNISGEFYPINILSVQLNINYEG